MSSVHFFALCFVAAAAAGTDQPEDGSCLQVKSDLPSVPSDLTGPQPSSLSFGCPELCMSDDVNTTKIVSFGGYPVHCSGLKDFVEERADSRDCLSLIDRFAPLCCSGEWNQSVPVNDTCAECDACIIDGMCLHATPANIALNESECDHFSNQTRWCGENSEAEKSHDSPDSHALAQEHATRSLWGRRRRRACPPMSARRRRAGVREYQAVSLEVGAEVALWVVATKRFVRLKPDGGVDGGGATSDPWAIKEDMMWERLTVVDGFDGAIGFSNNGKFLRCQGERGMVSWTHDEIFRYADSGEKFSVVDVGAGRIALQNKKWGKYMDVDLHGVALCVDDAVEIQPFILQPGGSDSASPILLGIENTAKCPYGYGTAHKETCEEMGKLLLPQGKTAGRTMVEGHWDTAATGCTLETGYCVPHHPADFSAHWNTFPTPKNKGHSPVCARREGFEGDLVGVGYCSGPHSYKSLAWELSPNFQTEQDKDSGIYLDWRQMAIHKCLEKFPDTAFVSVWKDAGYRCYSGSTCTSVTWASNVYTWSLKSQDSAIRKPRWRAVPGKCTYYPHTKERCRAGSLRLHGEPSEWMGCRDYTDFHFGPVSGSGSLYWDCAGTSERTGWAGPYWAPVNFVIVHYNADDDGAFDMWPQYCSPFQKHPIRSPLDSGCCSIGSGALDRCDTQQSIRIHHDGKDHYCYKKQICQFEFVTPISQGKSIDWWCGHHHETMRWGLYYDTLQIHFHSDGKIEWNPWWCGRSTEGKNPPEVTNKFAHLFGLNTAGDLISNNGKPRGADDINRDVATFVENNKGVICSGISASAIYDQLMKPSGVCWRAGMTGRSSLFPHHDDYGTKTSLLEEGTAHWRSEKEDSPFVATAELVRKNASLMQALASQNTTALDEKFIDVLFKAFCDLSGGTDCHKIGKESCGCYCVDPGTCTQVTGEKLAKAMLIIFEMAADIAMLVGTGGTANALKATAKATAKAALKKVAGRAAKAAPKVITRAAQKGAELAVKAGSKMASKGRILKRKALGYSDEVVEEASRKLVRSQRKDLGKVMQKAVRQEMKEKVAKAFEDALKMHSCTSYVEGALADHATDMDWLNDPSYDFGNGQGIVGNLETLDITGVVALIGIFHEADCAAQLAESEYNVAGGYGDSCPR